MENRIVGLHIQHEAELKENQIEVPEKDKKIIYIPGQHKITLEGDD